jgi:nitrogen fixation NifU-like protein
MDSPHKSAKASNTTCGDSIRMDVKLGKKADGTEFIESVLFSGVGCAISQASASLLTERVLGESVNTVLSMDVGTVKNLLGTELTPSRVTCATLPLEVLMKALVQ